MFLSFITMTGNYAITLVDNEFIKMLNIGTQFIKPLDMHGSTILYCDLPEIHLIKMQYIIILTRCKPFDVIFHRYNRLMTGFLTFHLQFI